jgi:hypothetical protein
MIVEINGECYKAEFSCDGKIEYYKMIDGQWVLHGTEDLV